LGYILKAIVTTDLTKGEYCSARFYPTRGGYVVGKKPGRTLSKISVFIERNNPKANYEGLLMGVIQSYKPTGMHVPFLRVYLEVMEHVLTGVKPVYEYSDYSMDNADCPLYECDDLTWAAFTEVYGYGPRHEEDYRRELEENIMILGVSHIAPYPWIYEMFKIDFEL
jgi:hypothetical protein